MKTAKRRGWGEDEAPRSEGGGKYVGGWPTILFIACLGLMFCYVAALMLMEVPGCLREIVRVMTK